MYIINHVNNFATKTCGFWYLSQQLASVRLDRPLLKLRLMPRRRKIIATPLDGGGTPPPAEGGTVTVPLPERQNGTETNQPIEGGGGPPEPLNGVVEELGHCSQKGVEDCLSDQQVEEELHHMVAMVMVMGVVMVMEEVVDHLPQGEMEEMAVMMVMMEMVVEETIHHHRLITDSHDTIKVE